MSDTTVLHDRIVEMREEIRKEGYDSILTSFDELGRCRISCISHDGDLPEGYIIIWPDGEVIPYDKEGNVL